MISPHGLGVGAVIGGFALAGCVTEPKTGLSSASTHGAMGRHLSRQHAGFRDWLRRTWTLVRDSSRNGGLGDVTGKSCSYALPHSSAPDNPIPILLDHPRPRWHLPIANPKWG
jgi:hypothetical protein